MIFIFQHSWWRWWRWWEERGFNASQKCFPPSYSPVGWFSPLNSINFHFPNLISWIFSISLSPPPALRIIPRDDIFQCCSQAIGEIITNSFCRQNMAFRRKEFLLQSCGWVLLILKINSIQKSFNSEVISYFRDVFI